MAAINLSTLGVQLHYAVEAEKGVMPTTGFTRIYGIKSTPSLNPAPDTIETTTLDETEYKTYVDGLKEWGIRVTITRETDVVIPKYNKSISSKFITPVVEETSESTLIIQKK